MMTSHDADLTSLSCYDREVERRRLRDPSIPQLRDVYRIVIESHNVAPVAGDTVGDLRCAYRVGKWGLGGGGREWARS